jgi:hypothetical protein
MFDSKMIDVVLGIAFLYALVATFCSAIYEALATIAGKRAQDLENAIAGLLTDCASDNGTTMFDASKDLREKFYKHPLIQGLCAYESPGLIAQLRPYFDSFRRVVAAVPSEIGKRATESVVAKMLYPLSLVAWWLAERLYAIPATLLLRPAGLKSRLTLPAIKGQRHPSYIPPALFSHALLAVVHETSGGTTGTPLTSATLRSALEKRGNDDYLQRALLPLIDAANYDLDKARKNIEAWYDQSMDRVSGWYKREAQMMLFWIALFVCATVNIDTLTITRALWNNESLRSAMVVAAQNHPNAAVNVRNASVETGNDDQGGKVFVDRIEELAKKLNAIKEFKLPLGRPDPIKELKDWWNLDWHEQDFWQPLLGWLITAIAAGLGAPFWFDLVGKLVNLRGTGKKQD